LDLIEKRDSELEKMKSQNNTPIKDRDDLTSPRSRNLDNDFDEYNTRRSTYTTRTNNRYNNDDEALSQLDATENDLRRRDFDRRKEEEEYRRRQERIEELQRERRVDDYDARVRKGSATEPTERSNYGQSATKKQNFQRSEHAHRVVLYK